MRTKSKVHKKHTKYKKVSMANKFTQKAESAINAALALAEELGHSYIGTEHILLAILEERDCVAVKMLESLGIRTADIRQDIATFLEGLAEISPTLRKNDDSEAHGILRKMPTLAKYGRDLL